MPFLKTIKCEINRKYSLQFCTPTEDIFKLQTVLKYLNQQVSYCLIPGIQNGSLLDTERLLLQILPYTKNCIVDITLPYIEVVKKKTVIRHLGRYILCDKQLIGIRIKPSDYWPKSKTIKQEISPSIENFYKEHGITNFSREIVIGQFLVVTQHFKMAPLFTSELSSLLDNTTINILNDYYSMGCQIFSIVNDLTEDKKKHLKDSFDILKNYRRDSTVVVCSGMHVALDPTEVYKTKSYAIQTAERLKKIHVSKLDQVYTEQFIADLNQTKKGRKISFFDDAKPLSSDIEIVDCKHLRVRQTFERIDFISVGRFQEPMDIEEEQNDMRIKENQLLLYIWNLFVNVNKWKPFILPCPMNEKDQKLLNKILQLENITDLQKSDFVSFFKLDPKAKLSKKYETSNFKSFNLEKLSIPQGEQLLVYFSFKQRILLNNIQKDDRFLREIQNKLVNCTGCIGEEVFKAIEHESTAEIIKVADEDQKFIEKFLARKSGASLQLFYLDMVKYYPRTKLTAQFVQNMYNCLQLKINKQFNGSPFQVYILQSSFEEVKHIFAELEQKFFFRGTSIKNQQDPIQGQRSEQPENNFRVFLKKINGYINSQKRINHICHICGTLFNKKERGSFGRQCLGCSNFICYVCFDKKTGETAQSQEQFQQCLVCQSKCDCQKCMKKKYRNQGISDFAPQKSSFFRSYNNFHSSTQNFRMNEEDNIQFQGKNSTNMFPKLQLSVKGSITQNNFFNDLSGTKPEQIEQIPIQPCWTCELQNRVERIIKFECSKCRTVKCLECQKSQNSKRSWVLRGNVLCNKCLEDEQQSAFHQAQNKILKSKIIALQHDLTIAKRQRFLISAPIIPQSSNFGDFSIVEEAHEHESQSNPEQRQQKGSATPIFDRSNMGNKGKQSPTQYGGKNNPSQSGSVASFGGKKNETKNQDMPRKRKNSSNSSGSRSVASKKSEPAKKQIPQQKSSKRKNSSGSEKSSIASFKQKPSKAQSNSSKGSKVSGKQYTKKNKFRGSSAESGEFQQSSSSNQEKKQPKRDWKKNHHQNTDQPDNYDTTRGGYRGRGDRGRGGRGGNRDRQGGDRESSYNQGGDRDFKKWDNNNDKPRDFQRRNDDQRGSNNNRFNNNNGDRQGGYNNDRQGGRGFNNDRNDRNNDRNNDRSYESSYEKKNNNNERQRDENKGGKLFVNSNNNKPSNNDQDVEY